MSIQSNILSLLLSGGKCTQRFQSQEGEVHLRENFIVQQPALLGIE